VNSATALNGFSWDQVLADAAAMAPALQASLLVWWELHGRRGLDQKPWMVTADGRWPECGEALDPYGVFVAEVMLQQTQLAVVLPYWRRWMVAFSDLGALAAADEQQVLLLWQGLGYYSRARRLHQAAGQLLYGISESRKPAAPDLDGSGLWPDSLVGWQALPGLGRSTAASILSSAFDHPEAILDGNVKRVLARLIAAPVPPARQLAGFWLLSEMLLDRRRPPPSTRP